ncbi:MAG: helix-turn-helix transcriptional regulator [Victivallaceae bacterium]
MKESTLETIRMVAKNDPEITEGQLTAIIRACKTATARKLINAKEAMRRLEISRPTLRQYVRLGKLHEIKPSPRKTRFDIAEVERLFFHGSEA